MDKTFTHVDIIFKKIFGVEESNNLLISLINFFVKRVLTTVMTLRHQNISSNFLEFIEEKIKDYWKNKDYISLINKREISKI